MLIESTPYSLQNKIRSLKARSCTVGFVPTMGALHEGHLSLIETSIQKTDKTVVSIFVNPTQFGKNEDFDQYPRQLENDLLILQNFNIDILFTPTHDDIYPHSLKERIQVKDPILSKLYCGVTRPQFLDGVLGVVLRLFNIVMPDKAFFGEKDYQQLIGIQKMAKDLFLSTEIVGCPIIREKNGLAMSSRNAYLSKQERQEAAIIYQGLCFARKLLDMEETDSQKIIEKVSEFITKDSMIRIDYIAIVDPNTLKLKRQASKDDRILFAGYLNQTRLIDNLAL